MANRRTVLGSIGAGLLLVALVLPAAPAAAQGRDRMEEELRRTDEILDRAAEVVRQSDSVRARDALERGYSLQRDARGQFQGGRYALAGRITLQAREAAGRAVMLAREDTTTRERAFREMERTERELGRAREEAGENAPPETRRLLDEADALLDRARATFAEQHYQGALRLALAAQRLARQAIVVVGGHGPWRLGRDLERTDHLLERLEAYAESATPEVQQLLEHAAELQRKAWEAFHEDRPREAHSRTREARQVANRARAALGAADDPRAVEAALRETQAILDRAAEVIRPSGSDPAVALLERAMDHQARARAALGQGDLRRALAQTRVARSVAKRALQLAGEKGL